MSYNQLTKKLGLLSQKGPNLMSRGQNWYRSPDPSLSSRKWQNSQKTFWRSRDMSYVKIVHVWRELSPNLRGPKKGPKWTRSKKSCHTCFQLQKCSEIRIWSLFFEIRSGFKNCVLGPILTLNISEPLRDRVVRQVTMRIVDLWTI